MNDSQLYRLCKKYGSRSLQWRHKFAGLLPLVYKRRLYEKRGFSSIFEFAAKLAGMTKEQVRLVLNLEKRFETMPVLHSLLVKGEVSVNKLTRVAGIATPENEAVVAEKVRGHSQAALEVLVRDFKNQNGSYKPQNEAKSLRAQTLNLSEPVHRKLLELQNKGVDLNKELEEFLRQREEKIAEEKETLAQENMSAYERVVTALEKGEPAPELKPYSRYINAKTRRLLQKEHGQKCAIAGCPKDAEEIHHTARYAISRSHDPRYLAPLCRGHHEIAHMIDEKVRQKRAP